MSNPAYQAARARASRDKIIAAALRLFVEHGFAAAKLQDIAALAGVSTATLFKHFPKKDDMLHAAIATLAEGEDETTQQLENEHFTPQSLRIVAQQYARRLDNPMMLGLIRLGVLESLKTPEIGPVISNAWRKPFIKRLSIQLDQGIKDGILRLPDKNVAVRQFFGLITDALLWPRLLGLSKTTQSSYRDAVVDEAIRTFLSRYTLLDR